VLEQHEMSRLWLEQPLDLFLSSLLSQELEFVETRS